MADKEYGASVGGLPFRVDPEQAEQLQAQGAQVTTPEMADKYASAQRTNQFVEDLDPVTKVGVGGVVGGTLGVGKGALGRAISPELMQSISGDPYFQGGDVAGTLALGALTGGESAAARAGVLEQLASPAERAAMAGAEGLMGMGKTPAAARIGRLMARGAAEGALINMGHTVGDGIVDNKPLAIEALAASGAEGALFGGLFAGALGGVGEVAGKAKGALSSVGGRGKNGLGVQARRLGMSVGDVADAEANGGLKNYISTSRRVMERGEKGITFKSPTSKISAAVEEGINVTKKELSNVLKELDKSVPGMTPSAERLSGMINDTVIVPRAGTTALADARQSINAFRNDVAPLLAGTGTWEQWFASEKHLASKLGKGGPVERDILQAFRNVLAESVESAAESSGNKALTEKIAALQADIRIGESLKESIGKKAASEALSSRPVLDHRDWGTFGVMASMGNPVFAGAVMASKATGRMLTDSMSPAIAEMAYNRTFGVKAVQATQTAKTRVRESVARFFSDKPRRAASSAYAQRSKPSAQDAKAKFDKAVETTSRLVSQNQQARIQAYADNLIKAGYPEMAKELVETNARATRYLQHNLPKNDVIQGLRPAPKSRVLNHSDYKFLRIDSAIKEPFSLIDKIDSGEVSRDEMMAMKYVYPELHKEIVTEAVQQIADMKSEGKYLDLQKISTLGIVLDYPVDSVLEPEYIGAVQASLKTRQQEQAPPQPDKSVAAGDLMTPMQKSLA